MLNWLIIILLIGSFPKAEERQERHSVLSDSLMIQVLNYDQLKPLLHNDNDTTYVVNFWATWCAPCVKELPYFVALDSIYLKGPFKLILVSLDFKKDYLSKLQPFVTNRNLEPFVLVLEDSRANYWIEDIDPSWSGAIPATLVYRGSKRTFYERSFHHVDELRTIVKPFLN
jgi:thiol-disulfide isomerase/thioredoxin